MFIANPTIRGRTTPVELRRAMYGFSFEESNRVSARQNARAKPSCAGGEVVAVAVACGSGFEEISLVSIDMSNRERRESYPRLHCIGGRSLRLVANACILAVAIYIQQDESGRAFNATTSTWKKRPSCFCDGSRLHGNVRILWTARRPGVHRGNGRRDGRTCARRKNPLSRTVGSFRGHHPPRSQGASDCRAANGVFAVEPRSGG